MHLDEENIQRILHGELVQNRESAARAHLLSCAACRARLAAAERDESDVNTLLSHLDHAVPHVEPRVLTLRARTLAPRWHRWAASIAVALGLGGVAYAIPGSPLPAWIEAAADRVAGRAPRQAPPPASATDVPSGAPEAAISGIAIAPGLDARIHFALPHGRSRVSLTDGSEIVVRAPAGAATFTSHADRLVVDNVDANAAIEIDIPRDAPRVAVTVGDETILLKEGGRVTSRTARMSGDTYVLDLGSSAPPVQPDAP